MASDFVGTPAVTELVNWSWDKDPNAVHSQNGEGEQNPFFQLGNFEDILEAVDHADFSSAVPPAAVIFRLAVWLNLSACTVRGMVSSPSPKILIGRLDDLIFLAACKSSGVTIVWDAKPLRSATLTI